MRVNSGSAIGTAQGMKKRINNAILRVINTTGLIYVGGLDSQNLVGTEAPVDGDLEAHLDSGWDTLGQLEFYIDNPYPAHITAIISQLVTEDR